MLNFDIEEFVEARCELNRTSMVATAELYDVYLQFSKQPMGRNRFVHRLLSLYPLSNTTTRSIDGKMVRAIRGIKLKRQV